VKPLIDDDLVSAVSIVGGEGWTDHAWVTVR
jgi:hypothetical protein